MLGIGAIIIFAWPSFWPVLIANSLMAIVGDVFGPAVGGGWDQWRAALLASRC
jgi:hypothetical protein